MDLFLKLSLAEELAGRKIKNKNSIKTFSA
jgi:hypothetical protein